MTNNFMLGSAMMDWLIACGVIPEASYRRVVLDLGWDAMAIAYTELLTHKPRLDVQMPDGQIIIIGINGVEDDGEAEA